MDEIRVTSWCQLLDLLYADSWKDQLCRFRSDFAFRGLESPREEFLTGLMGLGEGCGDLEGHLLRNFRKYACRDAVQVDSVWNWLALAQHHGLPTRLMDWTFSQFVALHFATEHVAYFAEDSIIWCIDFIAAKRFLPKPLKRELTQEGANVFTAEMLDRIAPTLKHFDGLGSDRFLVFLEPPSLDQRIINQFALFSLLSGPEATMKEWVELHPDLMRRVIIPHELKWEIRDKLDQANITERVLYPGLDGLSRWLQRQYAQASSTAMAAHDGEGARIPIRPRTVSVGSDPPAHKPARTTRSRNRSATPDDL